MDYCHKSGAAVLSNEFGSSLRARRRSIYQYYPSAQVNVARIFEQGAQGSSGVKEVLSV